jgi:hypothetical protein
VGLEAAGGIFTNCRQSENDPLTTRRRLGEWRGRRIPNYTGWYKGALKVVVDG